MFGRWAANRYGKTWHEQQQQWQANIKKYDKRIRQPKKKKKWKNKWKIQISIDYKQIFG